MVDIKNIVKAKYKAKNIKTTPLPFFFAIINKKRANTISNNNLTLIETNVCKKLFCGAFDCPPIKITIQIIAIAVKDDESIKMSERNCSTPNNNRARLPIPAVAQPKNIMAKIFLRSMFI